MSAATLDKSTATLGAPTGAIARRFAWKELRTLRGLWLAAAVLAVFIQGMSTILSPPSAPHATILFSTALAAAVLYAVAAAASTFSLEHEDETYDFLAGLPTTWWPVYLGKLTVVAASSVILAATLSLVGVMLRGFETPTPRDAHLVLGVLGVAILEAIAWGTLFSLVAKRPLLAAILTLIVAAVSANLALVLSASPSGSNLMTVAYVEAIPLRVVFIAVALAASALVARRWLTVGAPPISTVKLNPLARWRGFGTRRRAGLNKVEATSQHGQRRRMLAHLLWQTWREAKKPLLLPIVVAAVLALGNAVVLTLLQPGATFATAAWLATSLFIPAMYGALAFSADKRRGGYRFLAEHAARPRYVWLARHIVWLGVPLALTVFAYVAATAIGFRLFAPWVFDNQAWWAEGLEILQGMAVSTDEIIHASALAWWGILAAYAIGQFCSMLMRSEILSAFLALVASVLVAAWCAVCFAWQLPGWLFVLPIAAAFMLATWFRAGDWLTGRNTWRAWLKPLLVLIAPFVLIGVALPGVRLAQISTSPRAIPYVALRGLTSVIPGDIESIIAAYKTLDSPEARETAALYERALQALDAWRDADPLEPWQKPQYAKSDNERAIDETKIPPAEREAYQKAKERRDELIAESQANAVNLAVEASRRPNCYFDFNLDEAYSSWPPQYEQLNELLTVLSSIEPDQPFDRLLAALRMSVHLRVGQPSVIFTNQLAFKENDILQKIGAWAGHDSRTKEEMADALNRLTAALGSWPSVQGALVADHRLVQDALSGKTTPVVLIKKPNSPEVHLAYLENFLPWERRRALQALNCFTWQNIHHAERVSDATSEYLPELGLFALRRLLQPTRAYLTGEESWVTAQPTAATSYLARLEYEARTNVRGIFQAYLENETYRGAVRLQIALLTYRRDHDAYPTSLNQLVPDYLHRLPFDPYFQLPFEYEPAGLDLPLRNTWIGRLEPYTPFIWSPGLGNARIKKQEHSTAEIDESDPQRRLLHTREDVYQLIGDDLTWSGERVFVFPLPK
jgi:hypothetical protein